MKRILSIALTACLLLVVSACASRIAETPAQKVYALKSEFNAALPTITAFVESDKASLAVKKEILNLVKAAEKGLKEAEDVVRKPNGTVTDAAVAASFAVAREAVNRLLLYWKEHDKDSSWIPSQYIAA
jgi:protein involved in sex pheromone biosynthesis